MENDHAVLLNSVLVRLGRNILLFQRIESALKFMLPFMHPKGSASGDEAFARFRDKAKGQTLGKLVENLQESINADTDAVAQYLERMVEQRNQLVHHFHEMPGVSLLTEAGCRAAIQVLDDQHHEAQPLQDLVHLLGVSLGASLAAKFKDDPEWVAVYTALKQELPAHVEYVDLSDPSETTWPTTRIVRALQEAESRTEPVNGLTSLARAGAFLRSLDPDLNPQAYGVSKLKRVLVLSEAFDIVEHCPHETSEPITLYRSKPANGP
ncbi:OST-HTH/LOTUS domain-containing protein [Cupriavidus numazuensis]|uniref:HTH OST-type domain-containing protein n=1 Tax=Cupriavidus numazuensis TaxID=221992 RepID=A0ABN7QFN1_9BURK|nr:OST-HTH/LOTUS domain-containing protein [Cupriavidus numazuensis]CAG2159413.1 hypothetical protein LMG26411_06686 [Cupriavidus numazuensis]